MRSRPLLHCAATIAVGALVGAACAATDSSTGAASGGGGESVGVGVGVGGHAASDTGTGGGFVVSSSAGAGAGGSAADGGGAGAAGGAGGGTGGEGAGGGCVGTSSTAIPIPLDIFIMLDQSGSMNQDAGNGLSRWETIQSAFSSFVNEPEAAGISLGIQFFGQPDPAVHGCGSQPCGMDGDCTAGCTSCGPQGVCQSQYNPDIDSCDASDYAWAWVPIAPLPGVGPAIVTAIAAQSPSTNTPSLPALEGAIDYAKAWALQHTSHVTVVAFATDGQPSECDIDQTHIDAISAAGFDEAPTIKTFVIGVGPALAALDSIAQNGGTGTAFHVDVDPMATDQFLTALNTIRAVALPCTYQIPPPPDHMTDDFTRVNVRFDPGDGSPGETFPKVADAAACPATGGGWYFDDESAPTQIILCGGACDEVSNLISGHVDVVLGCQTIIM